MRQIVDRKSPVITILFSRFLLVALVHLLVTGAFALAKVENPLTASAKYWVVFTSIVDVVCLILLKKYLRQEGTGIRSLYNGIEKEHGKNLLYTVGILVLSLIPFIAAGVLFQKLLYGSGGMPAIMSPIPLPFTLYSLIVWPLLWSVTEDLCYFGYCYPRLEKMLCGSGKTILLLGLVSGLQHTVIPIIDVRWAIYRFGTAAIFGLFFSFLYKKTKRLIPFNITHWIVNFTSVLFMVFLPALSELQ